MQRPLLWICVGIVLITAVWSRWAAPPPFRRDLAETFDGQEVEIIAHVVQKEKRIQHGVCIWKIYLSSISFPHLGEGRVGQITQTTTKSNHHLLQTLYDTGPDLRGVKIMWEMQGDRGMLPCIGDYVKLTGTYRAYESATNPGEFDAALYYGSQNIYGRLSEAKLGGLSCWADQDSSVTSIEYISHHERIYYRLCEYLWRLREHFTTNLQKVFPEEEASILMKMVLGDGSLLDNGTKEVYRDGGILHILAISGLHISLLGMGIYKGLRLLRVQKHFAGTCGILFLVLYGIMTGWSLSAVRAIGMYLVKMAGEILNRNYDMMTAMGLLAVILVLGNPKILWQSSFWLSFGAVLGMGIHPMLFQPSVQKAYRESARRRRVRKIADQIRSSWMASLSVSLVTGPLQSIFFYQLPVYTVGINLLVLPFVGVLVGCAILTMIFPGNIVAVFAAKQILEWYRILCVLAGKLPYHHILTGRPTGLQVGIYYLVLVGMLWLIKEKRKKKQPIKRFALVVWILTAVCILRKPWVHGFHVTMWDVGQGDAILVDTGKGQHFLFDCGSSSKSSITERVLLPGLQYYGIDRLDGVFLSHGDTDHIGGVLGLLAGDEYRIISKIYLPKLADQEEFAEILQLADDRKIPVVTVSEGAEMKWRGISLRCIHPPANSTLTGNAASACYLWEIGDTGFLLTGDLEGEEEQAIQGIMSGNGNSSARITVLKVAHHGSKYSTGADLLRVLQPKYAVISVAAHNPYGHPHEETLQRLEEADVMIYRTDMMGAIHFHMNGKSVRFQIWSEGWKNRKE